MLDGYGRVIDYLRISVTDRCNLRCVYCMPEEGIPSVSHMEILTFDEIIRLVRIFAGLGFRKFKLTGGEPLVRKNLASLVAGIKELQGVEQVTLTTNGQLLAAQLPDLLRAGLDAVNLSLDTTDRALYRKITRGGDVTKALSAIDAVLSHPELPLKLDCVLLGDPAQRLLDVAEFARSAPVHVRFIEMMPIGLGKSFVSGAAFPDLLERLRTAYGEPELYEGTIGNGPAAYRTYPGFAGKIGLIAALSEKFCANCNRVRLTSQGVLKPCLQYESGVQLRDALRQGADDGELAERIRETIRKKPKEHRFLSGRIEGEERRTMNGIGG